MNAQTTPEITMIEQADKAETNEAPIPIKDFALLGTMLKALTDHIERVVDRRFAALVESHKTLALMDDGMKTAISLMIDEAIENHEAEQDHWTEEQLDHNTEAFMDAWARNNDYITENQLAEKVGDVLDDVLSEKLESLLDGASVSISI